MQNKNLIRLLESLILLPIISLSMPPGNLPSSSMAVASPQSVLTQKFNTEAYGLLVSNQAIGPQIALRAQRLQMEAQAIDAHFKMHDMPLEGLGMKMAIEADNNDIDWRLLPAIAVRESTGGKNACDKVKNNSFGWGSCKIGFNSDEEAIETVAKNLGGNNPNTARHYDNKTIKQILRAYNPPSIVPHYVGQVMSIMKDIGEPEIIPNTLASSSDLLAQKE